MIVMEFSGGRRVRVWGRADLVMLYAVLIVHVARARIVRTPNEPRPTRLA